MAETLEHKISYPPESRLLLAVSGGVDSMSLLDTLVRRGGYEITVAHIDHGIRKDSLKDAGLVRRVAKEYGLSFLTHSLELGENASETFARSKRYEILRSMRDSASASVIVTAHHLDDRIETMLMNIQRGAGWFGRAPLRETYEIRRPFLNIPKEEIVAYAKNHDLDWREDSTNAQTDTPRNHIRKKLDGSPGKREELYKQLKKNDAYRDRRMSELAILQEKIVAQTGSIFMVNRSKLLGLSGETARDLLFYVFQFGLGYSPQRKQIVKLEHFAKTAFAGKELSFDKNITIMSEATTIRLQRLGS